MFVKKSGGKIFGATMTAAQKKAMNLEIQRQLAVYDQKHMLEVQAIFLTQLRVQFGFGPTRLKRIFMGIGNDLDQLCKRYEMDTEEDKLWLSTHILKDSGIDIDEWENERRKNND